MNLKFKRVEDAIQAASELGLEDLPWTWMEFLKSGWIIKECKECACGGKWGWFKPTFRGESTFFGCVCHNVVHSHLLLHSKNTRDARMNKLLKNLKPGTTDIGKVFFVKFGTDSGMILPREEFFKIDPLEVGQWMEVTQLDVEKELA